MGVSRECGRLRIRRGRLEAIHAVHPHVEEDHGEVPFQEASKGLFAGVGCDKVVPQVVEDGLQSKEIGRLIVYQQDVRLGSFRSFSKGEGGAFCMGICFAPLLVPWGYHRRTRGKTCKKRPRPYCMSNTTAGHCRNAVGPRLGSSDFHFSVSFNNQRLPCHEAQSRWLLLPVQRQPCSESGRFLRELDAA